MSTVKKIVNWSLTIIIILIIIIFIPNCDRNPKCQVKKVENETEAYYGPKTIKLMPGETSKTLLLGGSFFEWNCPTDGYMIRVFKRNGMPIVSRYTDSGGWILRISNCRRYQCWLEEVENSSIYGIQFHVPTSLVGGVVITYTDKR